MNRIRYTASIAALLTACSQPAAGGQAPGPIQPNIYEIAPEQIAGSAAAQAVEPGFIEVTGTGAVEIAPDRAAVAFALETRAETAAEASAANAEVMQRVLSALRSADLPGLELATYGYALQPVYAPRSDGSAREIIAYTTQNNVRATVDDVDVVGRVIDTAIGAGANRVSGISFSASDTDEAHAEALAEAVRDARAQAETIARALGHRLGPPLEVRGGAIRPAPMLRSMEGFAQASQVVPTPIEVGDQTVTASITIRFALGPELGG